MNGEYKMPPSTGIEWYNIYCDKLTHGMKVPKTFTDRVLTDFKNSGIGREGGWDALKFFTEQKNICIALGSTH